MPRTRNTHIVATLIAAIACIGSAAEAASVSIGSLGGETPERTITSTGTIANSVFSDGSVDADADVDSTADITVAWDMTLNSTTLSGASRRTLWEFGGGLTGFSATFTNSGIFVQVRQDGTPIEIGGDGSGDTSAARYVVTAADLGVERSWVASVNMSGDLRVFVDGQMVAGVSGPAITDWAGGNDGAFWALGGGEVLTDGFNQGFGAVGPVTEASVNTTKGLRLYEDLTTINVVPTFVATPAHSWVAGFNDDVGDDATWHDSVGGADITFSSGGEVLNATGLDALPFAYDSPAGNNGALSSTEFGGTGDATFEVVVRVDDLDGTEMIWEIGGNGSGSSLLLEDSTLQLSSQNGASNRMTVQTTLGNDLIGKWLHVVGVITESGVGNDTLELFVNGASVGTDSIADGSFTTWAGGSPWGLGTIGTNFGGEPTTLTPADFTGDIALFNHYTSALTGSQIYTQARSLGIVPAPAALPAGLVMLGAVASRRRRRAS